MRDLSYTTRCTFLNAVYVISLITRSIQVWAISWAHLFCLNATTCLPMSNLGLVVEQQAVMSELAHRGLPLGGEMDKASPMALFNRG